MSMAEYVITSVVALFMVGWLILHVVAAIMVRRDATRRYPDDSSAPFFWFLGTLLLAPLMAALYVLVRPSEDKPSGENPEMDNLSKVEKLHELKESGAISEEEFNEKKEELLQDKEG